MNIYLYSCCIAGHCTIKKVLARNFEECRTKIMNYYIRHYSHLDDTLNFNDFTDDLYEKHDINIGDIFEINEFL